MTKKWLLASCRGLRNVSAMAEGLNGEQARWSASPEAVRAAGGGMQAIRLCGKLATMGVDATSMEPRLAAQTLMDLMPSELGPQAPKKQTSKPPPVKEPDPKPWEVWVAKGLSVERTKDSRPVIIVQAGPDVVHVSPISSSELYDATRYDFPVTPDKYPDDWAMTSLVKPSYIMGVVRDMPREQLVRRIGALSGNLLSEFRDWSGL